MTRLFWYLALSAKSSNKKLGLSDLFVRQPLYRFIICCSLSLLLKNLLAEECGRRTTRNAAAYIITHLMLSLVEYHHLVL